MASSALRFGLVFVVAAAIALLGCANVDAAKRSITGETGDTCYTVSTAPLYAKASASSKMKGHLGLHERVERIRIERGFSLVVVGAGGLEGWVESAKLVRRLPESGAAPAPPTR